VVSGCAAEGTWEALTFQWCTQGGTGMSGLLQRDLRHHSSSRIYFTLGIHSIFSYIRVQHWSPLSAWGRVGIPGHHRPHLTWTRHLGQEDLHPTLPIPPGTAEAGGQSRQRTALHRVSLPTSALAFGPPEKKKTKVKYIYWQYSSWRG